MSLPKPLQPAGTGVSMVLAVMTARGALVAFPIGALGIMVWSQDPAHTFGQVLSVLGLAVLGGGLGGLAYGLVGRPVLKVPLAGPYLTGIVSIAPYMALIIPMNRIKDDARIWPLPSSEEFWIFLGMTVCFGAALGHAMFRNWDDEATSAAGDAWRRSVQPTAANGYPTLCRPHRLWSRMTTRTTLAALVGCVALIPGALVGYISFAVAELGFIFAPPRGWSRLDTGGSFAIAIVCCAGALLLAVRLGVEPIEFRRAFALWFSAIGGMIAFTYASGGWFDAAAWVGLAGILAVVAGGRWFRVARLSAA